MGIKAKGESLSRIIGMVLILIGLVLSIFLDFLVIINALLIILLILIETLWFIFSLFLKLEKNFFIEHAIKISIILSCFSIVLIILGIVFSTANSTFFLFVFKVISNLLIIICWHFCLSLYKKEKLIFFFSGTGYIIITLIYGITAFAVIPLMLITLGIVIIIISEILMKKKGLLNYI